MRSRRRERFREQDAALPKHKNATAERKRRHAADATRAAARETKEAAEHSEWALDEVAAGRRQLKDCTFGVFVRQAGHWGFGADDADEAAS